MRLSVVVWTIAAFFVLAGCDEPMPAYQEPQNVLEATVVHTTGDTILTVLDTNGYVLGSDLTKFRVFVRNTYLQLLQGDVLVKGHVNIFALSPATHVAVEQLGRANMFTPPIFQNTIAIQPGDSATLETAWYYDVVGGGYIWQDVPYNEKFDGIVRQRTYDPISFSAQATVQIFERVQAIQTKPIEFALRFITITRYDRARRPP